MTLVVVPLVVIAVSVAALRRERSWWGERPRIARLLGAVAGILGVGWFVLLAVEGLVAGLQVLLIATLHPLFALAHFAAALLIATAIQLRAAVPRSRSARADLEEWYRAASSRPGDRAPYR